MKKLLAVLVICSYFFNLFAQDSNSFIVNSDIPLNEQIPQGYQYMFPNFVRGHVLYKDLQTGDGNLNYNLLIDEMQFLDNYRKVLAIANPELINTITIDTVIFICTPKGYFHLIKDGKVKWLVKHKSKILVKGKEGAYGQISSTSAMTPLRNISGPAGRIYHLSETTEIKVIKEEHYWLSDNSHLLPVTQKNIIKFFPKNKVVIEKFITENLTDFRNNSNLNDLINYCYSLNNDN